MTKKTLSNKVLDKIKKEHVKPKPKWEFLLKNYIFWGAFVISILIGGLVASAVIFRIATNDWDMAHRLGQSSVSFGLQTLHFFWLIILAVFIFIAYYNFKHTKKGYKYGLPITIISSIIISTLLGFAFFGMGFAKSMDEKAQKIVPYYENMQFQKRADMWSQIDRGVMAGEVLAIHDNGMEVEDLDGKVWEIEMIDGKVETLRWLKEGMVIGIFGEKSGEGIFKAEQIRPWKGNFMKPQMMHNSSMKENRIFMRTT